MGLGTDNGKKEVKMISYPSPEPTRTLKHPAIKILLAGALAILATSAFAADPTHHFAISHAEPILAGDQVEFTITAHREDGSLISDAENLIHFYISNRVETLTHKLGLSNGSAQISIPLDTVGAHLMLARDRNNSKISKSGSFDVRYNPKASAEPQP